MPLSIDLSISCCRVIFFVAVFFFFGSADFSVVAAGLSGAGAVVVAALSEAGGVAVAAGAAADPAAAAAGAAVVAALPSAFWASATPIWQDAIATAKAMK